MEPQGAQPRARPVVIEVSFRCRILCRFTKLLLTSLLRSLPRASIRASSTSLRDLWHVVWRRRRFVSIIEGALLAACVLYCLIAPNQYEAAARVELRAAPVSSLSLDGAEVQVPDLDSFRAHRAGNAGQRSAQRPTCLARDCRAQALPAPGFCGNFASRFPGFDFASPRPAPRRGFSIAFLAAFMCNRFRAPCWSKFAFARTTRRFRPPSSTRSSPPTASRRPNRRYRPLRRPQDG